MLGFNALWVIGVDSKQLWENWFHGAVITNPFMKLMPFGAFIETLTAGSVEH